MEDERRVSRREGEKGDAQVGVEGKKVGKRETNRREGTP